MKHPRLIKQSTLIKALRPLALLGEHIPFEMHDDNIVTCTIGATHNYDMRVGDVRLAADVFVALRGERPDPSEA